MALQDKIAWVATSSGIVKIITFVISIIVITLYHRYANTIVIFINVSLHTWQFCSIVTPTSSFILLYFFISYLCDGSEPGKRFITEIFFNLFHAFLNLVVGCIIIKNSIGNRWLKMLNEEEHGVKASGAMFIFLTIAHVVDAIFIFKNRASNVKVLVKTPENTIEHEGISNDAF
uniref:MARVEL domain-containing protein n=1 Tax=Strigamia maritima TaxID=126957 RepID=T1J4K0_STRMM